MEAGLRELFPDPETPEQVRVPISAGWAAFFRPYPDETLGEFRDRILPVVDRVVTPQRRRVADARTRFERDAQLTEAQRRELDAAVADAGEALKDRLMQAILSEELSTSIKPSTAVAFARDLLELSDSANRRFLASLRDDQKALLDESRFDVADYLLFSTRWEDLLDAIP